MNTIQGLIIYVAVAQLLLLAGCTRAYINNDKFAITHGMARFEVKGADYTHVIYSLEREKSNTWHIYIEGDGEPWILNRYVSADPTPENPLLLRMMARDPAASLYLGRPCYHGLFHTSPCDPWSWTSGRYSERVVESMSEALKKLIQKYSIDELALIGHSGGGTLAILLAQRIPEVTTLITLAGNLNVSAWTYQHAYSPLRDSYNPADLPVLPNSIKQYHFIGSKDQNISRKTTQNVVDTISDTSLIVLDGVRHVEGWETQRCFIFSAAGFDC